MGNPFLGTGLGGQEEAKLGRGAPRKGSEDEEVTDRA